MSGFRGSPGVVFAALLSLLACAGGVSDAELEQPPLAVIHWGTEAAQAHAEWMNDSSRGPLRRGVARGEELGRLFGAPDDREANTWSQRYPGRLALLDPASGTVRRLQVAPPGAVPLDWSADHRRLLFAARVQRGYWQLHRYDLGTQEVTQLTHGRYHHARGAFGPNGRLVFTRNTSGGRERSLMVQDSAAGPARTLIEGVYVERVSWAPGGGMIVAAVEEPSRRRGRSVPVRTLFAVSPDAPTQVWPPSPGMELKPLGRGLWPAYGTTGDWFVFSAVVGDRPRLRRMRADGGGRRDIGTGERGEFEAALSPDGNLVAYIAAENNIRRLFVCRIDGSGERMVAVDGLVGSPIW